MAETVYVCVWKLMVKFDSIYLLIYLLCQRIIYKSEKFKAFAMRNKGNSLMCIVLKLMLALGIAKIATTTATT